MSKRIVTLGYGKGGLFMWQSQCGGFQGAKESKGLRILMEELSCTQVSFLPPTPPAPTTCKNSGGSWEWIL